MCHLNILRDVMHTHCQENVLWFGLGANQEPPLYKVHQIYIRNKESYFKKCAHEATSCKGQIAVLTNNLQHVVHIHAKKSVSFKKETTA